MAVDRAHAQLRYGSQRRDSRNQRIKFWCWTSVRPGGVGPLPGTHQEKGTQQYNIIIIIIMIMIRAHWWVAGVKSFLAL